MFEKEEWNQKKFLEYKKQLEKDDIEVLLVDTILKPIKGAEGFTITYNPFEMKNYKEGTIFVFYCDTGKSSLERLPFYKSKLPEYKCISLRGGRAYWRSNISIN